MSDFSKYKKYAEQVLDGSIVTGQYIKLACERYLKWFERDDIEFRADKCDKAVKFMQTLRHYQGKCAGKPFKLELWQKFIVYNIFGWYWKGTEKRVTQKVLITMARKQGKSFFASAIALYMLLVDGEAAAQILNVANNVKQAHLLFDMEKNALLSIDPKHKHTKTQRDKILFNRTSSYAQVLSSDSSGLDGSSPSTFILDETHEMKDSKLWDVMMSGTVYRENPLAIQISTSGFNLYGFLHDYRDMAIDILKGTLEDDSQFSVLYELDEGDDWRDPNVWIKSNPNMDVTVTKARIAQQVKDAINNASLEVGVRTKTLNQWVQSETTWIPDGYITQAMKEVKLSDFSGEVCYCGIDLAAVSDLAALAIMFPPNKYRKVYPDKFVFKTICYLPQETINTSGNREKYKTWARNKHLIVTPGNVCDYDFILNDLLNIHNAMDVADIAYDSYNATQFSINATNAGLPMTPFSQALGNFNKPSKEYERLMLQGKIIIDNNPIIRWCQANCSLKIDNNENIKPVKSNNERLNKIDAVIAMLQALGSYLNLGDGYEQ